MRLYTYFSQLSSPGLLDSILELCNFQYGRTLQLGGERAGHQVAGSMQT